MPQKLELTWYNKDKALIPTVSGRYGYSWVEPSDPRYCETHTLVLDGYYTGSQTPKQEDVNYSDLADLEPQTDNLLVLGESGDVLEALTRVPELAEKYCGQVKLVYIDPPFNTAQAFASYEDNLEHSIWLTMMRDRLLHLKRLLSDDGSIWVHLDDREVHRMRMLLDEVFGAGKFIVEIAWQKRTSPEMRVSIGAGHDSILVYSKNPELFKESRNKIPLSSKQIYAYTNPDDDPRGPWVSTDFTAQGWRPNQMYGIVSPSGNRISPPDGRCWRYIEKVYKQLAEEGRLWFGTDGNGVPRKKVYLSEAEGTTPWSWWPNTEVGHNQEAKKEIIDLFGAVNTFSTPKPERLLQRIIHIATNPGDLVLDCFAGSGTTAAVAQKMGRRWITCELLEDNFTRFILPRLRKVVNDEDSGGITTAPKERIPDEGATLPDGVTPDEAAQFISVLNKLIADDQDLKRSEQIKKLKRLAKTKNSKALVNWRGGGGFQVAHLSPTCFDFNREYGRVVLTEEATGQTLVESVAANLGFRMIPLDEEGHPFDAVRGNAYLYVLEGAADPNFAIWLANQVAPGQTVVLAATSILDGTREALRRTRKGSRVIAIPDDIFQIKKAGEQ